jgi:hypothetical protein
MSYLNANIPPIYCKLRREYLYDLKEHKGEASDCVIFGLITVSIFLQLTGRIQRLIY